MSNITKSQLKKDFSYIDWDDLLIKFKNELISLSDIIIILNINRYYDISKKIIEKYNIKQ